MVVANTQKLRGLNGLGEATYVDLHLPEDAYYYGGISTAALDTKNGRVFCHYNNFAIINSRILQIAALITDFAAIPTDVDDLFRPPVIRTLAGYETYHYAGGFLQLDKTATYLYAPLLDAASNIVVVKIQVATGAVVAASTPIAGGVFDQTYLLLDPDDREIYLFSGDNGTNPKLYRFATEGLGLDGTLAITGWDFYSTELSNVMAMSRDGAKIAIQDHSYQIHVVNLSSFTVEKIVDTTNDGYLSGFSHASLAFKADDNTRVYFIGYRATDSYQVIVGYDLEADIVAEKHLPFAEDPPDNAGTPLGLTLAFSVSGGDRTRDILGITVDDLTGRIFGLRTLEPGNGDASIFIYDPYAQELITDQEQKDVSTFYSFVVLPERQ